MYIAPWQRLSAVLSSLFYAEGTTCIYRHLCQQQHIYKKVIWATLTKLWVKPLAKLLLHYFYLVRRPISVRKIMKLSATAVSICKYSSTYASHKQFWRSVKWLWLRGQGCLNKSAWHLGHLFPATFLLLQQMWAICSQLRCQCLQWYETLNCWYCAGTEYSS